MSIQSLTNKNFCFFLLTVIVFLICEKAFGVSSCPRSENESVLFFSNGMFTDEESARSSTKFLRRKTNAQFLLYDYAYNLNESPLLQLLEVYYQKVEASHRFLWSYFSKLNGPKWFTELARDTAKKITRLAYIKDDDLQNHIRKYREYLNKNIGIVIISHSQGNFYSNRSYEYIEEERSEGSPPIAIVAVASPDSYVAGGGEYRTLSSDRLIRSIPQAMPYNVSNRPAGLIDHQFIKHYLNGSPSGQQILDLTFDAAETIGLESYYFKPGYLDKSLLKMNKWVKRFEKGLIKRGLSKAECLAISLFLKNENWFGVQCEERNLESLVEGAQVCFEDEWRDPDRVDFDCQLNGLQTAFLSSWNSPLAEPLLFVEHKECEWDPETIHKVLSQDVLDQALDFIKNPK